MASVQQLASRARPHYHSGVRATFAEFRSVFRGVAVFSAAVNLLMLAGPLYMLQIYDRVLASRSVPTLVALSLMLVAAYGFQGVLEVIRSRIVSRAATLLDFHLSTAVHKAVVSLGLSAHPAGAAQQPVRDLDQIRGFLSGTGPLAIVDLPWAPVFLAICFAVHPWLGFTALAGAIILFSIAVTTEWATRSPSRQASTKAGLRFGLMEADRRNAETIVAMNMGEAMAERWSKANWSYVDSFRNSADIVSSYSALSRILRLLLQSSMLGVGAYLVLQQELSAGAMIAASIMMGRALAPIDTVIANWRGFISARDSLARLSATLASVNDHGVAIELPPATRCLDVQNLTLAAPGTGRVVVRDVSFRINAGEALGVIGPSGAGKSSLLRGLVGIWPSLRGTVLLDDAELLQRSRASLAAHIGFVGQTVELFEGTIAANIARMAEVPDSESVLAAAQAVGAHEMILKLPNGYDTLIADAGTNLSMGQRQRIALARAFYKSPFLILLDEPNANLDADGDAALQRAIENAKARGGIVIMVTHRASGLAACDNVLVLNNGAKQAFGPKDEVLRAVLSPQRQAGGTAAMRIIRPGEQAL